MAMALAESSTGRSPAKLIAAAVGAGCVAALMGAALLRSPEPATASTVKREIIIMVLNEGTRPGIDDGAAIGPWHVTAGSYDEQADELRDFRLRSGSLNLGAARARLVVDAASNSFSFKLRDVVIARVPEGMTGEDMPEHRLIPLDTFLLGPVPYRRRIVAD